MHISMDGFLQPSFLSLIASVGLLISEVRKYLSNKKHKRQIEDLIDSKVDKLKIALLEHALSQNEQKNSANKSR